MKKIIIINAVAAKTSGAVTVLYSLLDYCNKNLDYNKYHIVLFTQSKDLRNTSLIANYFICISSWFKRIKWDDGGMKKYCEEIGIKPDLIISKQNTCTNWPCVPQLVYYDQPLSLYHYPWNPFKKEDLKPFLYCWFYKYYVYKYNQNAEYVVQLECIKDKFCKVFKKIDRKRVHVVVPDRPLIELNSIPKQDFIQDSRLIYLYPATPYNYKNHRIIIKAVSLLDIDIRKKIQVIFTAPKESFVQRLIEKYNVSDSCKCIGVKSYTTLLSLYKSAHVLLFPSKIESYGLPLIEATSFGLPIIAADLPYSHEVLKRYNNVSFINPDKIMDWKISIESSLNAKKTDLVNDNCTNSWGQFFNIAINMIN